MKSTRSTLCFHVAASLAALLVLGLPSTGMADPQGCVSGSSCITPTLRGDARPVTNGVNDVIVNPTSVITVDNRARTDSQGCLAAGASECIRPQSGTYSTYPYPFGTLTAMQPGSGLPAVLNWTSVNSVLSNMACAGGAGPVFGQGVTANGSNFAVPGSGAWPSGLYTCTLTVQNALNRTFSVAAQVAMTNIAAAPFGMPAAPRTGTLVCQDTLDWDPVAFTYTYKFYIWGKTVGTGPFTDEMVYRYQWNAATSSFNPAPGPWPTTTHTTFRTTGGIFACT